MAEHRLVEGRCGSPWTDRHGVTHRCAVKTYFGLPEHTSEHICVCGADTSERTG